MDLSNKTNCGHVLSTGKIPNGVNIEMRQHRNISKRPRTYVVVETDLDNSDCNVSDITY